MPHVFEAAVDDGPARAAIVSAGAARSYAELESRANQLARHLRSCGIGRGDLVGLYLERSPDAIVAILGIMKSGAAYVPLDPSHPPDRLRAIVGEAGIETLVCEARLAATGRALGCETVAVDDAGEPWHAQPAARLSRAEVGLEPGDLAYVLYTSGSTGRPKGVMAEHRNVVSFVAAFNQVIRLGREDRVWQGFSLGFDGSVEEMWMAFSNGATLLVPPRGAPRFGDDLARLITGGGATVLSTVPTSLATISDPLSSVRLLIVSGERCPKEAVARWATGGRRMLNVYGPTETTVNATAAECRPGRPITIGTPLPGYGAHILDPEGRPVAAGETGELYVTGPGVARGYLGQPELTRRHFVELPVGEGGAAVERAYRTGDLVSAGEGGELCFHGRLDDQVKLRGFRIELPEIEAVLGEHPSIGAAVVTLAQRDGNGELVAHVVAADRARGVDRNAVLALLASRLPAYMVPAFLDVVEALPTLSSGKVDRARLPAPVARLVRADRPMRAPRTEGEAQLLRVARRVFDTEAISVDDNFFLALGGYSLLAAQLASELRRACNLEVAIRDVYEHPTVEALAAHLGSRRAARAPPPTARRAPPLQRASRAVKAGCAALQALALYLIYGVTALPAAAFVRALGVGRRGGLAPRGGAIAWLLVMAGVWPVLLLLSVAVKWIAVGRYRPGAYPLWGWTYFRFWLARRFQQLALPGLMAGTPLLPLYLRLMGARVGKRCSLDTAQFAIFDLLTIGDDSSAGAESQLLGYRVEDGRLLVGAITVGDRCFMGTHAALGLDTRMADDSRLGDLSLLPDRASLGRGQSGSGSPAAPGPVAVPELAGVGVGAGTGRASARPVLFGLLHLLVIYALGLALLPAALPSAALLGLAARIGGALWLVLAVPVAGVAGLVAFCLWLVVLSRAILPRGRAGVFRTQSAFYLRKWAVDLLLQASRVLARPLYTTIYLPAWLRMLGAKIGRHAEISTVSQMSPELTELGEQSFFADGSMIGGRRLHRGLVQLAHSRVGRRSFVGNSAILPVGTSLGEGCLLGCLSAPPADRAAIPDGTEWLGSPSFALPRRQKVEGFDARVTHEPTPGLVAGRLAVDALRIVIPSAILTGQVVAFGALAAWTGERLPLPAWLLLLPVALMATAVAALACVVATKKLLMGTFRPVIKPLWSPYVWLNEAVNGAYETVAAPLLAPLLGTPFCAPWLRLMGCKIGRDVYLETTLFSEFDLVHIGDHASLNAGAVIQNHLFEDRVMKASTLRVGDRCSVGNMAVVLYDTEMQPGSSIGPLSLLMKGETLPPDTRWLGIPTAQVPSDAAPAELPAPAPVTAEARAKSKARSSSPEIQPQQA